MTKCIDCKKEISRYATRCHSCTNKITKTKNGKPKCKICGKQLINYGFDRCQSCAAKERLSNPKNNSNYKDGRSITKNYCQDCGIEIDWKAIFCRSCFQKGERNSNFIDGSSGLYPLEFNDELKESIRKRDNYTCQNCGMTEEEHLKKYNRVLEVHHKDHNRKNNKKNNLITSCKKCNLER